MGTVVELPTIRRLEDEINRLTNTVWGGLGSLDCTDEKLETLSALVGHLLALLVDRRVLSTSDLAILFDGVPKLADAVAMAPGANELAKLEYCASDLKLPDKGPVPHFCEVRPGRRDEFTAAAQAATAREQRVALKD